MVFIPGFTFMADVCDPTTSPWVKRKRVQRSNVYSIVAEKFTDGIPRTETLRMSPKNICLLFKKKKKIFFILPHKLIFF